MLLTCWRVLLLFHIFLFLLDFSIFVYTFKCFVRIHKLIDTLNFHRLSLYSLECSL